jgi:hypothetical protein
MFVHVSEVVQADCQQGLNTQAIVAPGSKGTLLEDNRPPDWFALTISPVPDE